MTIPPGSIPRPSPRTPAQGKRLFSNDRIKTFTKLQIQEYIKSFFDQVGQNRDLLGVVSPRSLNYNIDKSFDPALDPTQRKLQLARYFNELLSFIPAILIVDGGVRAPNQSVGLVSDAFTQGQKWFGFYPIFRQIPISVVAAAKDQETADDLSGLLSLMFNELRNLAGEHYVTGNREQGERWAITLPNAPVEISPLSEVDVKDDPIEQIFYSEASLEVYFEDMVAVQEELPQFFPGGAVVGDSNLASELKPIISISDQISIHQTHTLFVDNFQHTHRILITDSSKATLSPTMILTPRNYGKFKIQIYDPKIADKNLRVVAEKEIEIV